jgi:hypothetical protein
MPKMKIGEQWLAAWAWIQGRNDAPKVLVDAARIKQAKYMRKAVPYKPQLKKEASTKYYRDKLRDECEEACKAIVKARDLHQGWGKCVTCTYHGHDLQWGHFVPQNDSDWLRYDPRNTAMQCRVCNLWKEGRQVQFAAEIDRRADKAGVAAALVQEAADNSKWRMTIWNLEGKLKELKALIG